MLYGANPYLDQAVSLRPAMSLTAPVIAIKALRAGDTVGYGSRWQAEQACNVAVLAIGYADGYPRQIQAGTPVWLNGQRETILRPAVDGHDDRFRVVQGAAFDRRSSAALGQRFGH